LGAAFLGAAFLGVTFLAAGLGAGVRLAGAGFGAGVRLAGVDFLGGRVAGFLGAAGAFALVDVSLRERLAAPLFGALALAPVVERVLALGAGRGAGDELRFDEPERLELRGGREAIVNL
jgi:hypothetical protein